MRGDPQGGQSDESLARQASAGDRDAFAALVERHYDRIHRIAWRLTGSPADAEDLAQEICASLGRRIRSWQGRAAFTTWLYRVVLNAVRDAARRSRRAGALERGYAEAEALNRAGDADRAAQAQWLAAALGALPADLRETAVLVLDEGLGQAQAAAVLGISAGTVAWRMSEIRRRLRQMAAAGEDARR